MSTAREPMSKVIEDVKTSMTATATYLAFLENVGRHAFRREIKKTDVELKKYISDQNMNLIQMSREHLLAWKWINETGRLPMFEEYRSRVRDALKEDAKEAEKMELEAMTQEQLGKSWNQDPEPVRGEPGTVQGEPE